MLLDNRGKLVDLTFYSLGEFLCPSNAYANPMRGFKQEKRLRR